VDLVWIGGDEQYGAWPVRPAGALDPRWLPIAEWVPVDGHPRARWLYFLDAEDGAFGCRGAGLFDSFELPPLALCIFASTLGTVDFSDPPHGQQQGKDEKYQAIVVIPFFVCGVCFVVSALAANRQ